jgi:hypothetical protein
MPMSPRLRKLALTAHVTCSVGWLGAVLVYIVLAITGIASRDVEMSRAAYLTLETIGWFVVVPCSFAALVTGLIQSLGTEWGLLRHYWIIAKLAITTIGTIILLAHMPAIGRMSGIASDAMAFGDAKLGHLPIQLVVHATGGLALLITATTLSIYKPWGKTRYGRK